jgi:sigma-B regulation protein RsbU (phosphoserine phosphatase)
VAAPEDLQRRVADLESVIEVTSLITSSLDLREVLRLALLKAQNVLRAEASSILLWNPAARRLEFEVAHGEGGQALQGLKQVMTLELGQGIAGQVAQTRQSLLVADAMTDPRVERAVDAKTGYVTRSILAVPLVVQDRLVGVAEVLNPRAGAAFTPADLALFEAYCRPVAVAIENARLHQAMLEREREAQQLAAAAAMKESLLPQAPPADPLGRLLVAAKTIPSAAVGGDFYDFLGPAEGQILTLIGDVSGKGLPPALLMAKLISDFRLLAPRLQAPERILGAMNELLTVRAEGGMFATCLCLRLDLGAGRVDFSSAGHGPMIRRRQATGLAELVEAEAGSPLGILPDEPYTSGETDLAPGDTLLLATDGVVEARAPGGERFTYGRLLPVVAGIIANPSDLIEQVLAALKAFCGDAPRQDDVTLVALRRP